MTSQSTPSDSIPLVLNDELASQECSDPSTDLESNEPAHRLSWKSIEAFDLAVTHSGIENQLAALRTNETRKSKLYSVVASAAVVMAIGYIIASFFVEDASDATGSDHAGSGSPKFLTHVSSP